MTETMQGNVYRALTGAAGEAPGVTIQIFHITARAGCPTTCRARMIFSTLPAASTAWWFDGEARHLPGIIKTFAVPVELWIPDGATAELLRVPGMGALLELPGVR